MKKTLFAVAICAVAGSALADEEPAKLRKARSESELEKELGELNTKCGTKLTVAIDWGSFDADDPNWKGRSVSSYCSSPINALSHLCDGQNAKAYIQKNLETMTCHAAKNKAGWNATVEKGHLHWNVSPDSANNDDYARAQIVKNL